MEESNNTLICVKCGTEWGVTNPFTNNCENEECKSFCSWGYELNKPSSFAVTEDGSWIPKEPVEDKMDKSMDFTEYLKDDKEPISTKEFGQMIRDSSYKQSKKGFDFDTIFNFCQEHRVEVLLQDDLQYHCIIDYHLEKTGSWAIEMDSFTAFVVGINQYIKHHNK